MDSDILPVVLIKASAEAHFAMGRNLYMQYLDSLDFDLYFQDVDRELRELHREYQDPVGALLLALDQEADRAVGCIGVRRFDARAAELKRMYVLPSHRGLGLGKKLLARALEEAGRLGYARVLLDSDSGMETALGLYRAQGFEPIAAYRFNPLQGAVYMKKELRSPSPGADLRGNDLESHQGKDQGGKEKEP